MGSSEQPLAEGLFRKTVRSTIWTFAGQQATTVLALATSIAIGRLIDQPVGVWLLGSAAALQVGGVVLVRRLARFEA